MHTITPCRRTVSERFPIASFVVQVPESRYYEVACATDPRLFHPDYRSNRRPGNFYSSRAGGLATAQPGGTTWILPPEQLKRFAGSPRIYYALGTYAGRNGESPQFTISPDALDDTPSIQLSPDFTGRSLDRRRIGPGRPASAAYGSRAGEPLRWGGDAVLEAEQGVREAAVRTEAHVYDDGFDPALWGSQEQPGGVDPDYANDGVAWEAPGQNRDSGARDVDAYGAAPAAAVARGFGAEDAPSLHGGGRLRPAAGPYGSVAVAPLSDTTADDDAGEGDENDAGPPLATVQALPEMAVSRPLEVDQVVQRFLAENQDYAETAESDHFTLHEFRCRAGGVDCPREYRGNLQILMDNLEVIRAQLGNKPISILSGYRTPEHNHSIGGARRSRHMVGQAADIRVEGVDFQEVYDLINRLQGNGTISRGGLHAYPPNDRRAGGFVHYDVRGTNARWGAVFGGVLPGGPYEDGADLHRQRAAAAGLARGRLADYQDEQLEEPLPVGPAARPLGALTLDIVEKVRILRIVGRAESGEEGYAAVSAADARGNGTGTPLGLAWGLLLFNQRSGDLGRILRKVQEREAAMSAAAGSLPEEHTLAALFGGQWQELVRQTDPEATPDPALRLAPVGGGVLWEEPWLARFRAAGRVPHVQAAQNEIAVTRWFDRILPVARWLGLDTARGVALLLDRVVHAGFGGGLSWVMGVIGPIRSEADRTAALAAVTGNPQDLAGFQRGRGIEASGQWNALTHAALTGALRELGENAPITVAPPQAMQAALLQAAQGTPFQGRMQVLAGNAELDDQNHYGSP